MGERLIFTFALTGRREWGMVPRALPWATDLLGFQPAQGRRQGFFRTISTYLIFLDFEPLADGDGGETFSVSDEGGMLCVSAGQDWTSEPSAV